MNAAILAGLIGGGAFYTVFVGTALKGILKLRRALDIPPKTRLQQPAISIVVAARNEEVWIGGTLTSLLAQKLQVIVEVIVVDDRSTDKTGEIVMQYVARDPRVRLIVQSEIAPGVSSKKAALAIGIAQSTGEIILLTDADCTHDPDWAESLAALTALSDGMVVGQARFAIGSRPPFWQKLQSLDFAAQGILSAGLVAAGTPYNCSGASLAFTRAAFAKVGGWENLEKFTSGDDELLMRKFVKAGIPVVAATGRAAVVQTRPPASLGELWHQRVRWGSKTLHYPVGQRLVLVSIFFLYVALTAAWFAPLWGGSLYPAIISLSAKIMLDSALLMAARPLFSDRMNSPVFVMAEFLHPPVIVALSVAGAFGGFRWKEASYSSRVPA